MIITKLIILAIGIPTTLLVFVLIVLILYFIIPNRKFTELSENEIDEEIKILNFEDRLSFNYKNVKVSLKRDDNKLLIEPYFNKIIESLLRALGFFLAMLIVMIILTVIASFLVSMRGGDTLFSDGTARSVSWPAMLFVSAYMAISYFFSKIIRKKVLNKLLIWKHKKNWEEFYFKYEQFRFEDLTPNNDDDDDDDDNDYYNDDAYVDEW